MNLLARRQENLPEHLSARHDAADELFRRIFQSWMPEDFSGMEQELEIGEKEVTLSLPCPGRKAKEIDVELMGDLLTVKSCSCSTEEHKPARSCVFSERCDSMCVASFRLPVKVIGKEAKAHYQDGILNVTIPRDLTEKKEPAPIKIKCEQEEK